MKRSILLASFFAFGLSQSSAVAQDLPAGPGKELVENICAACHGTDVITAQKNTAQGWKSIVDDMVSRGAGGTDDELKTIVEYLTKNFGKEAGSGDEKKASAEKKLRVKSDRVAF